MTIEDRITELMAHHKESLARMVAESEPDQAAEIIAELRAHVEADTAQRDRLLRQIGDLQTEVAQLLMDAAAHLAEAPTPPEAPAEPAQ